MYTPALLVLKLFLATFDRFSVVDKTAETSGGAMISLAGYYSFPETVFVVNTAAMERVLRLGGIAEIKPAPSWTMCLARMKD